MTGNKIEHGIYEYKRKKVGNVKIYPADNMEFFNHF